MKTVHYHFSMVDRTSGIVAKRFHIVEDHGEPDAVDGLNETELDALHYVMHPDKRNM